MNQVTVPQPTKAELQIGATVQDLVAQAGRCVVKTDEAAEKATSLLSAIKAAYKRADDERTALVGPLNFVVKSLNERFKATFLTRLESAERKVKEVLGGYLAEKRRIAEEIERKERERVAKMEAEGRPRAAANAEVRAEVAAVQAEQAGSVRGSHGGSASLQQRWTYEVVDIAKVPREWLVLDDVAVGRAVRRAADPVREIPGIKIFAVDTVAGR